MQYENSKAENWFKPTSESINPWWWIKYSMEGFPLEIKLTEYLLVSWIEQALSFVFHSGVLEEQLELI